MSFQINCQKSKIVQRHDIKYTIGECGRDFLYFKITTSILQLKLFSFRCCSLFTLYFIIKKFHCLIRYTRTYSRNSSTKGKIHCILVSSFENRFPSNSRPYHPQVHRLPQVPVPHVSPEYSRTFFLDPPLDLQSVDKEVILDNPIVRVGWSLVLVRVTFRVQLTNNYTVNE